jgi:hypothetical protein
VNSRLELNVIGALVFAVVWEICAIQRTPAAHRGTQAEGRPPTDEDFWRQQRTLLNDPAAVLVSSDDDTSERKVPGRTKAPEAPFTDADAN